METCTQHSVHAFTPALHNPLSTLPGVELGDLCTQGRALPLSHIPSPFQQLLKCNLDWVAQACIVTAVHVLPTALRSLSTMHVNK